MSRHSRIHQHRQSASDAAGHPRRARESVSPNALYLIRWVLLLAIAAAAAVGAWVGQRRSAMSGTQGRSASTALPGGPQGRSPSDIKHTSTEARSEKID